MCPYLAVKKSEGDMCDGLAPIYGDGWPGSVRWGVNGFLIWPYKSRHIVLVEIILVVKKTNNVVMMAANL